MQAENTKTVLADVSDMRYQFGMTPLAERMAALGLSDAELARRVGSAAPQIWRFRVGPEGGGRKLPWSWAEKIAPHVGVTDPADLMRPSADASVGVSRAIGGIATNGDREAGSIYEVEARAGAGEGEVGAVIEIGGYAAHPIKSEWILPPDFIRHSLGARPHQTLIMEVINDSMLPTLAPGDRVVVDTSAIWANDDSVWLIDDGTPKVKRLRLVRQSDPPIVEIMSDNPSIRPQTALLEEIRILGRVCGRVSRL